MAKGELSPLLEGSPDLAAYYEGAQTIENFKLVRQAGVTRWEGSRFIKEVKDSTKDTILWPFEFSVDDSYMLEIGDLYIRVYKNKAPVLNMGVHVEIVTPFVVADIRTIHFTQSADIIFTFHSNYSQRKLGRVSDTSWSLTTMAPSPPPSFEDDTFLGANLGATANGGTGITFRVASAVWLNADVGRQIIVGASRAIITSFVSTSEVIAQILDPFNFTITAGPGTLSSVGTAVTTSVNHGAVAGQFFVLTSGAQSGQIRRTTVAAGSTATLDAAYSVDQAGVTYNIVTPIQSADWMVRLSPQSTLDPTAKGPVGTSVTLVAGVATFRVADVGKYVKIYGGAVRITTFNTNANLTGIIEGAMGEATLADPPASAAGTWTLEVSSWSVGSGYPRTGDFFQGRLYQAATPAQPTTFWGSASDDFENYAIGITAEDAVEYTMASRQINRIEWLTEKSKALFIGTSGSEHIATGSPNQDSLIGGDTIPQLDRVATNGCAPIQPIVARQSSIYVDRSRRKIMMMGFDLNSDGQTDTELTVGAEHITESGIRLGPLAFQKRLNPRLYFVREDGQLVSMTFFPEQKVIGFTRRTTPGSFGCAASIPGPPGQTDQVWAIVLRGTKRYVELFETAHELLTTTNRTAMQTDCGIVVTGLTGTSVGGLTHLNGYTVDVLKNGSVVSQAVVSGGTITLAEALVPADVVEVGLHYESTLTTMEPNSPTTVMDGLPRTWESLFARFKDTIGGTINGQTIEYTPSQLNAIGLFSGIRRITPTGTDTDGRVTIKQTQPYPMTVLSVFGHLMMSVED